MGLQELSDLPGLRGKRQSQGSDPSVFDFNPCKGPPGTESPPHPAGSAPSPLQQEARWPGDATT